MENVCPSMILTTPMIRLARQISQSRFTDACKMRNAGIYVRKQVKRSELGFAAEIDPVHTAADIFCTGFFHKAAIVPVCIHLHADDVFARLTAHEGVRAKRCMLQSPAFRRHFVEPEFFLLEIPCQIDFMDWFCACSWSFLLQDAFAVCNQLLQPGKLVLQDCKSFRGQLILFFAAPTFHGSCRIHPFSHREFSAPYNVPGGKTYPPSRKAARSAA